MNISECHVTLLIDICFFIVLFKTTEPATTECLKYYAEGEYDRSPRTSTCTVQLVQPVLQQETGVVWLEQPKLDLGTHNALCPQPL